MTVATEAVNASHSAPQKDSYFLARGGLASLRLTNQHFVLTRRQGWLLHPDISLAMAGKDSLEIADLATGNGIWATEISRELPTAKIVGLDMSPAQFPLEFARPGNVHYDVHNLFDTVPDKYQDRFDILNIRLLIGGIADKDKDLLMRNLLQMMKPGGYIQWGEIVTNGHVTVDQSLSIQSVTMPYLTRIQKFTRMQEVLEWAGRLPQELRRCGFVNVQGHAPPLNPGLLQYEHDVLRWSWSEIIGFVGKSPKPGAAEEMVQAAQELEDEERSGRLRSYDWLVSIGQKPA